MAGSKRRTDVLGEFHLTGARRWTPAAITGIGGALMRRSAAAFLVRGLEILGKLALYLIAASALGAHEAGIFFVCLTWAHLLSTAARLGLDKAVTRHLAADLAVRNRPAARRALRQGLTWTLVGALAAGLLTWTLARPLSESLFQMPDLAAPLAAAAFLTATQTLAFFLCAALVGLDRSVVAQFLQFASWPLVGVAALLAGVDSAIGLVLALAAAMTAVTLVAGALLRLAASEMAGPAEAGAAKAEPLPPLRRTARSLLVVEVVQVGIANLPVLVLAAVASAATVGGFSVAMRISMLVWMALISLTTIAAPHFAGLHRKDDRAGLARLNRRTALLGAASGGTAALLMLLFPATLLGLFGAEYRSAAVVLQVLAAGQLVNALYCGQDVLLAMSGKGRLLSRINLLQFGSGIVLMLLLVPWLGDLGAAASSALVTGLGAIANAVMVRRVLAGAALPWAPPLPARLAAGTLDKDGHDREPR